MSKHQDPFMENLFQKTYNLEISQIAATIVKVKQFWRLSQNSDVSYKYRFLIVKEICSKDI